MNFLYFRPLALGGLLALLLSTAALAGGPFALPEEGPVAFRRDRIPLEIEDIRRLSKDLTTMAETVSDDTPDERRLAAQCLALALALEPGNREARRMLGRWEDGRFSGHDSIEPAVKGMDRSVRLLDWLEQDAAGRDAGQLAACLKDVISQVGQSEERYRAVGGEDERGQWDGWVPVLAAYEKAESDPDPDPDPKPNPNPNSSGVTGFSLVVDKAEITIPLWYRDERPKNGQDWVLKPGRMSMNATHDKDSQEFFAMGFPDLDIGYSERMGKFSESMAAVLSNHHVTLPYGLQVRLGSPVLEDALSSGRPQTVSAATLALANAAISGKAIDADTILLGRVDSEGRYLTFSNAWASIRCFGGGKGQKLIIPSSSKEYMEALLTMDQVGFFLEYEVIMASNLEELFNAVASEPEGALGEACAKFAEIQKVAEGNKVRTFVANSHVRKRLQEVVKASPQHVSASLLLMQSNSSRPFNVSRNTLISEMRLILEPLAQVKEISWDQAEEREFRRIPVAKITNECKEKIDALEKFVGREEKEIYKRVDELYDVMREYDRALNRRGDYDYITGLLTRTSRDAVRAYKACIDYLDGQMEK